MFNRNGHKVEITKGVDKGAHGIIIDIDSGILFIQKTEGEFNEMYGTSAVYGFELDKLKVIVPLVRVKDKVAVLGVAYDGEKLPDGMEKESTGVVTKVNANECIVSIKKKLVAIPTKFITVNEGVIDKKVDHNLDLKVSDIVFFKKNEKSTMARIIDKNGLNYELEDRSGSRYEVKKRKIFRKISIKDMRSAVATPKVSQTKEEVDKIKEVMTSIRSLRSLNVGNESDAREYKQRLKNKMEKNLSRLTKSQSRTLMSLKGCKVYVQSGNVKKSPSSLKREYWRLLCEMQYQKNNEQSGKYQDVLGVGHYKQGKVYTSKGTISLIAKRLKSEDLIHQAKKPFINAKHVGVEIECYCDLTRDQLNSALTAAGLAKNISLVNDRSIKRYGEQYPIEVRIIATERSIKTVMEKTMKILTGANVGVNNSCGLHVHLDMRNRSVKKCYRNLYNSQEILFKTSSDERANNQYCMKIPNGDFMSASKRGQHYECISAEAYQRHKTLEVRMHEGTIDVQKINNWISILIAIVDSKKISKNATPNKFVDQLLTASKEDREYFQQRLTA